METIIDVFIVFDCCMAIASMFAIPNTSITLFRIVILCTYLLICILNGANTVTSKGCNTSECVTEN